MKKIFKYSLVGENVQDLALPRGARIIAAQTQYGGVCLWAIVEPDAPTEYRRVVVIQTGHPLPDNIADFTHVGTVQVGTGPLVVHVFVGP